MVNVNSSWRMYPIGQAINNVPRTAYRSTKIRNTIFLLSGNPASFFVTPAFARNTQYKTSLRIASPNSTQPAMSTGKMGKMKKEITINRPVNGTNTLQHQLTIFTTVPGAKKSAKAVHFAGLLERCWFGLGRDLLGALGKLFLRAFVYPLSSSEVRELREGRRMMFGLC